ncbi:MAG: hypothetical protein AAFQ94_29055 [Bacteroidota bacterium]
MKEKIELQRERDFSENISTLFQVVRTQFKRLFGSILFIAGPIILIASILLAYAAVQNLDMITNPDPDFLGGMLSAYSRAILGYVGLWFGYSMVGVVTFSYLKVYQQSEDPQTITTDDIWKESKKHILKILLASILTGIMIALGAVFLIIPGLILAIYLSMVNPTIIFEKESVGESINKSFRYISDNFWITVGLAIVVTIITYIISIAFSIPSAIMGFVLSFNSISSIESGEAAGISDTFKILYMAATMVANLAGMIISAIPNVSIALHYFNLKEQKDSTGLMGQISQMGKSSAEEEETY